MFQHCPSLDILTLGQVITNSTNNVFTFNTSRAMPANTCIFTAVQLAVNNSTVGTITWNIPGVNTFTFSSWLSRGSDLATHAILQGVITSPIPAGTTFTFTRTVGGNFPAGIINSVFIPGSTGLQNLQSVGASLLANQPYQITNSFNNGTILVPDFRKTNATICFGTASTQTPIASINTSGGNIGYGTGSMPAVSYNTTNFAAFFCGTVYALTSPGNQSFNFTSNATSGGNWAISAARFTGA